MTTTPFPLPGGFDASRHYAHLLRQVETLHPGLQVESLEDGFAQLSSTPSRRPHAVKLELKPGSTARDIPAMADFVARKGLTLVEVRLQERFAVAAKLLPVDAYALSQLAKAFGCAQYDVDAQFSWHTADDGGIRADKVVLFHTPPLGYSREEREKRMLAAVAYLPGGHAGWSVRTDHHGTTTLQYRVQASLPRRVDGRRLLPDALSPDRWASIPLGLNARGEEAAFDLEAGPHSLLVGGTGSGKSTALRLVILGALARGFECVFIDPVKKAAGIKHLAPYTRGFFTDSVAEAADVVETIYQEVRRRVNLIDEHDVEAWYQLPEELGVRPMMVIIDEYASLVTPPERLVGLDKDHPKAIENAELTTAKAIVKATVGAMAREARSAGIHLVLSLQRPDADVIGGGSIRENLGSILQLVAPARTPSREALAMIFPGDLTKQAQDEIAALSDGTSKGFGLAYVDGAGVEGVRVGFIDASVADGASAMTRYLDSISAPRPTRLEITASALGTPQPEFTYVERRLGPPSPTVVDEFTFSLGDLDAFVTDDDGTWGQSVVPPPRFIVPEGL